MQTTGLQAVQKLCREIDGIIAFRIDNGINAVGYKLRVGIQALQDSFVNIGSDFIAGCEYGFFFKPTIVLMSFQATRSVLVDIWEHPVDEII